MRNYKNEVTNFIKIKQLNYRVRFHQTALIEPYVIEKDVSPPLLSRTRGNDPFSQSARGLCQPSESLCDSQTALLFSFPRSCNRYSTVYRVLVLNGRQKTRDKTNARERKPSEKFPPRVYHSANIK